MASIINTVNTAVIESMQLMNKIDFHTHILPAIDDGSQSESQSYRMLKLEAANGVGIVIATPHFYPDGPEPKVFIKEREVAYKRLMAHIPEEERKELPLIKQGAEVLLGFDTSHLEDLRLLAIEGTDYILIEMPYSDWDEWVYEAIERIRVLHKLTPIIAHVERYIPFQKDTQQIYRLMCMKGVIGQLNTRSLLNHQMRGLCHKLIANDMVHLLGSDAHRGQHLLEVNKAYDMLEKKHGKEILDRMQYQSEQIILNKSINKVYPQPFKRILGNIYR